MSTIKANTLLHSDGSTTNPPAIPALDKRMATAWINFRGAGVVAINDSKNISSIVDIGVGRWRIYFATTMSNSNYAVVGTACEDSTQGNGGATSVYTWTHTASNFYIQCLDYQGSYSDENPMSSIIFGGQS